MIPYVISEAYPDYKSPFVEHDYGVVKEEEMETYFLDKVSNFVLDRTGDNDLSLQDVNDFFDNYFEECFMMNAPWMTVFPGIAISCAVLGFNLLGDSLRDALDPRLK